MLRGARRNMIVVRTRDSRMFEEAYFVMRRNASTADTDEPDMLWEANRILESALPTDKVSPRRKSGGGPIFGLLRGLVWFGMGILCGGGSVGLLWLLL